MRSQTLALGIGSNLHNPLNNLRNALQQIKQIENLTVKDVSSIYESDALVPVEQESKSEWNKSYLNAVVLCEFHGVFDPLNLLKKIKEIEMFLGRVNSERWAPRIIDIDILYVENIHYQFETLQIPHNHLLQRPFALLPLLEVWPELMESSSTQYDDLRHHLPTWAQKRHPDFILEKPFRTKVSQKYFWPQLMGILNMTSDSFSDGGKLSSEATLLQQAEQLLIDGAEILDIGAESTRPNAVAVSIEEESEKLRWSLEIVEKLKSRYEFKISLDCRNSKTLYKILPNFEIDYLNDVSGFSNSEMKTILKEFNKKAVVMHSFDIPPKADQTLDLNENPIAQLVKWWKQKREELDKENINTDQLIFDPGIGFGKTKEQNLYILKNLNQFAEIKNDILIGHSRKSFQTLFSNRPAHQRDLETALVTQQLNLAYTQFLRLHDMATQKMALVAKTL